MRAGLVEAIGDRRKAQVEILKRQIESQEEAITRLIAALERALLAHEIASVVPGDWRCFSYFLERFLTV